MNFDWMSRLDIYYVFDILESFLLKIAHNSDLNGKYIF